MLLSDKDLSYLVESLYHLPADADRWQEYSSALRYVRDQYEEELAALRHQLAAAQEWQPVEDGEYACTEEPDAIIVTGDTVEVHGIAWNGSQIFAYVDLPPDLRLCRRTRQEPPA